MQHFTPISAFIGGALIGLSAIFMLLFHGRIAGVSGIFHGLYPPQHHDIAWRFLFLFGLMIGSFIYHFLPFTHFVARTNYPAHLLCFAGILVGLGTKLSGGCTSGHGVCGIARMSLRSVIATLTFFLFALITVYIMRNQ